MANNYRFGTGFGNEKLELGDQTQNTNFTQPWYMSIRVYLEAYPTDQPHLPVCMGGFSESNHNMMLAVHSSGVIRYGARNDVGVQIGNSSITVPLNAWHTIGVGWDGTDLYVDIDGGSTEVVMASFNYTPNDQEWQYRLFENGYIDGIRVKDFYIIQNNGGQEVRWECDEGSGTTCTGTVLAGAGNWDGTITNVAVHEVDGPADGPATSTTFGPVSTNDDPSVTGWQWEASDNGGSTWGNAEVIMSDVSGETTTTLAVNSATAAEDQTQVRCRATSTAVPAGVVSQTATLTVV